MVSQFLERLEQAVFDVGGHRQFMIRFVPAIGDFFTAVSVDGGKTFDAITDGDRGVVYYDTFAEALEAIIEHNHQM